MKGLDSEETMKKAYKLAYEITDHKKTTYTIKKFCQMLSGNPYTKVTEKQKNFVRFNKHPEEVIIITTTSNGIWNPHKKDYDIDEPNMDYDRISSKIKWIAENWAERAEKVTIILCNSNDTIEIRSINEEHPEWFHLHAEDSIYRRCANIWAKPLGWTFSAPLYRDKASDINEMQYKRPDAKEYKDQPGSHVTKTSHTPKAYLNNKTLASEEECKEFFNYYKYLHIANLLTDALDDNYTLCPHCGRPILKTTTDCEHCGKTIKTAKDSFIAELKMTITDTTKIAAILNKYDSDPEMQQRVECYYSNAIEETTFYEDSYNEEDPAM